jgi:hypothetical protein
LARLAMTSLVFMFVEVPLPVWKTSMTNSPSSAPAMTSSAAFRMASAIPFSTAPSSQFTCAAAYLMAPIAWMNVRGKRSPLMGKFSTARAVCAP